MSERAWYSNGLRFTCTQCGNCCTGPPGFVWVDNDEAPAIAQFLGVTTEQFLRLYTHDVQGRRSLNEQPAERGLDCVFLRRDHTGKSMCSIYPVRPEQCRTWPFWPDNLRSRRAWEAAARTCPGMNSGIKGQGDYYPIEKIRIIRDRTPSM